MPLIQRMTRGQAEMAVEILGGRISVEIMDACSSDYPPIPASAEDADS